MLKSYFILTTILSFVLLPIYANAGVVNKIMKESIQFSTPPASGKATEMLLSDKNNTDNENKIVNMTSELVENSVDVAIETTVFTSSAAFAATAATSTVIFAPAIIGFAVVGATTYGLYKFFSD